jgi:hypothetical protein
MEMSNGGAGFSNKWGPDSASKETGKRHLKVIQTKTRWLYWLFNVVLFVCFGITIWEASVTCPHNAPKTTVCHAMLWCGFGGMAAIFVLQITLICWEKKHVGLHGFV